MHQDLRKDLSSDCSVGRTSFTQQKPYVYQPLLAQLGEVDGIKNTLSAALTHLTARRDDTFGFKSLDMGVDLPVIDPDSPRDISRGVTVRLPSQVADNRRPQGIRVENTQSIFNLIGQSGNRLIDARHSIIFTHLCQPLNLRHR